MDPLIKVRVPLVRNDRHHYVDPLHSDDFDLAEFTLNAFDVTRIDKIKRRGVTELKIFTGDLEPIHILLEKDRFLDEDNYKLVKEHLDSVYVSICRFKSIKTKMDNKFLEDIEHEMFFTDMLFKIGLVLPSK